MKIRSKLWVLVCLISGTAHTEPPNFEELRQEIMRDMAGETRALATLEKRIRASSWLPKLETRFTHDFDSNQSLKERAGEADTVYFKDTSDFRLGVRMRFNLDYLMFHPAELSVYEKKQKSRRELTRVLEKVHQIYFSWLELYENPKLSRRQESQKEQFLQKLNIYTDGWFGKKLRESA